jgi:hypothetical protein
MNRRLYQFVAVLRSWNSKKVKKKNQNESFCRSFCCFGCSQRKKRVLRVNSRPKCVFCRLCQRNNFWRLTNTQSSVQKRLKLNMKTLKSSDMQWSMMKLRATNVSPSVSSKDQVRSDDLFQNEISKPNWIPKPRNSKRWRMSTPHFLSGERGRGDWKHL